MTSNTKYRAMLSTSGNIILVHPVIAGSLSIHPSRPFDVSVDTDFFIDQQCFGADGV